MRFHDKPSIKIGSQVWKGALALFSAKAHKISSDLCKGLSSVVVTGIIINNEANTCTKKYFRALSVEYLLNCFVINGINDKVLISKASQAKNQDWVESTRYTDKAIK